MLVNFEIMPSTSRIWIYQGNRAFSAQNKIEISNKIEQFIAKWQRHGEDLKASYLIKYNQFIIIAVDENYNDVSGCSIDASVNLIKQLEDQFQLDLTNKLNVSFKENELIKIASLSQFQKLAKQGTVTENTIVFNNLVQTKAEFEQNWEIPAAKSWHQRFLKATV